MLEIPESHTIARQLEETVSGKRVTGVIAAQSPHGFAFYFGEPSQYAGMLSGKRVGGVRALAGQVELQAEDARLLLFDGVNARYLAPDAAPPTKHQLLLRFDDGSAIVCTVQMYGGLCAFPDGAYDDNRYYRMAKEKPSPLTAAFDERYFERLCAETPAKLSAKALLATEQRIPGLGNGCLQDILYNARINPQTKLAALRDADLDALFHSVKNTLAAMTAHGGRDTEKDLFGVPGGYRTILSSRTAGYACAACGGGITRKAFLGGNVYFCAACQPVVK